MTKAPWGLVDVRALGGEGDAAITSVASIQHGLITSLQLRFLGLDRQAISHRVKRGYLQPIHRGVFAVGRSGVSGVAALAAAVLACGKDSVVSFRSAAFLWGLLPFDSGPVHVSTPGVHRRDRDGVKVHRVMDLVRDDVRLRELIPVTSPALTILNVAAQSGPRITERILNQAHTDHLVSRDELIDLHHRTPGQRGWGTLLPLLRLEGSGDFSRQDAEKALIRLIRRSGLPTPRRNMQVHGHELDYYWPALRLNVELDGYQWHSARHDLNRDRDRDTHLASQGVQVIRFTRDQLKLRPETVLARLAAAVAIAQRFAD